MRVSEGQTEKGQCHYFKMDTESEWTDRRCYDKNSFDLICVLTIYDKTLLKQYVVYVCV